MIVKEVLAKGILSKSKVYDYVVNPYTGCQHGCSYCYARFMKRFTGHHEPWGTFVDVKINAADLLAREARTKKKGRVWVSGVCDPYQPLEAKYKLTQRCLAILIENNWPVTVQTRSPLVLRDIDLLKTARDLEVGMTVPTAEDKIRRIFEPNAPPIARRIDALEKLHQAGIKTFSMVAPLLPGAEKLAAALKSKVDSVLIDRINYAYGDRVYKEHGLEAAKSEEYFREKASELASALRAVHIESQVLGQR